ncbi:MAG: hypothetical protein KAT76_00550 [Bacteroidales bacterium]|nr:hypothetical protein [Bacteroidales bacterium]
MKNKALLDEIAKNNTIIDYHLKRLKKKPDQLHEIDIDLLSEKFKEAYSLILELKPGEQEQETTFPEEKEVKAIPEVKEEAVVQKMNTEPQPEPEPEADPKYENKVLIAEEKVMIEVERPEQAAETEPEPLAETPETIVSTEEPDVALNEETEEEPTPKTTADLFSGATTIADSFQAEKDNTIAATVTPQAVQDLKTAIGINDKFLFINDLFNGNPTDYNDAIEKLNMAKGADESVQALDGFREQFGWTDQSEAFGRLRKIVHSKYN